MRRVSFFLTGTFRHPLSASDSRRVTVEMSVAQRVQPPFRSGTSLYGKVVLLQSIVIASFSFWMFKEYENNRYFQEYVRGKVPTGFPFLVMAGILALGIIGLGLYSRREKLGKSEGRDVRATSSVLGSPRLEDALPANQPSRAIPGKMIPSPFPLAYATSPVSPVSEPVEPPVLKSIEPTLGFVRGRAEPRPFPVVIRLEPPEEHVREEEPVEASQPVLKRIAPKQSSSVPPLPLGSVRRVGPDLEPSGRPLVWKSRSDLGEIGPTESRDVPVLDKLRFLGEEEHRAGSEGGVSKKRPRKAKRPGSGQSSQNQQTA